MRPATAVPKRSDSASTRSIWKKYESIRPDNNQFYCFKTISEILDRHNNKAFKDSKHQIYYHKVSSPKKLLKQTATSKDTIKKKISSIVQRNPNMKKTTSNNMFSSKQIGKQNRRNQNIPRMKTENQIKTESKFLPYRQQTLSIFKYSKMLKQTDQNEQESKAQHKVPLKDKQDEKQLNRRIGLRHKDKTRHIIEHTKRQESDKNHEHFKEGQFVIQEWQNFQQDPMTFSMLINASDKFKN